MRFPISAARNPGEAAVGKSSLVLRFVQNDFNENTSPTIGAAFLTQSGYSILLQPHPEPIDSMRQGVG